MGPVSTILASTIVMSGAAVIRDTSQGHPRILPVISGFLLAGALILLSFLSPEIAKALAVMGAAGSVLTNGPQALGALGRIG